MNRYLFIFLCCTYSYLPSFSRGLEGTVKERLSRYFAQYKPTSANIGICKLDSHTLDPYHKKLEIYASKNFGYQPFTPKNVEQIY